MTFMRTCSLAATVCAALLLNGCFVISTSLPAGTGPKNDDRLVGDWRGVDSDNGNDSNVYIHFQKPDPAKPLRVVWVEGKDFQVYEMTTMRIGNRDVFASRTIISDEKEEMPKGYFLGFYEVKGNEASFWLLDAEKIGNLIAAHRVRGVKGTGKYDMAKLTGSPAELSRFLASADAQAAAVTPPARLRRLPETRQ